MVFLAASRVCYWLAMSTVPRGWLQGLGATDLAESS